VGALPGQCGANLQGFVARIDGLRSATTGMTLREIIDQVLNRSHLHYEPGVTALHDTNGRWDLQAELRAGTAIELSHVLDRVRLLKASGGRRRASIWRRIGDLSRASAWTARCCRGGQVTGSVHVLRCRPHGRQLLLDFTAPATRPPRQRAPACCARVIEDSAPAEGVHLRVSRRSSVR
jgi:hypothetical protein